MYAGVSMYTYACNRIVVLPDELGQKGGSQVVTSGTPIFCCVPLTVSLDVHLLRGIWQLMIHMEGAKYINVEDVGHNKQRWK